MTTSYNILSVAKHIHCVGVGGIGISALARKFLLEKKVVSGSDIHSTPLIKELRTLGARIWSTHHASHITRTIDVVIYTKAVRDDNVELVQARKLNIPTLSYSQALGIISANSYTIAVAGSHGKTTTTGLIAWGLIKARKNPTVVVGSLLKDLPTNFIAGKSDYFVVEACEYSRSFLDLSPRVAVITNIDNDHLDFYKTKANIIKAFIDFAQKIPREGYLITDLSDSACQKVAESVSCHVIDYQDFMVPVGTKLIGLHNAMNIKAAHATLTILHVSQKIIHSALRSFSGTARRMEYKGKTKKGMLVYDDYAHHPTEIQATLRAFREQFSGWKIVCIFQPHLYSRTKLLFQDFVKSFSYCDVLLVLPIYAARENKDEAISSEKLVAAIQKKNKNITIQYIASLHAAFYEAKKYNHNKVVVITMGAGESFKIGEKLLKNL